MVRNCGGPRVEKADLATNYRNKLTEGTEEAIAVDETWGIEVKYENKRIKKLSDILMS